MNSKALFFALCLLFGSAFCTGTIKLQVSPSSTQWWLAVHPENDGSTTVKVELQEASSTTWTTGSLDPAWGYYSMSPISGSFQLPLSFRLTSSSGSTITAIHAMTSMQPNALIDTLAQYSSASAGGAGTPATQAPTVAPAKVVTTSAPTTAPTKAATTAPTKAATTAPTKAATTAPTKAATTAPTTAPTTSSSSNLCAVTSATSAPMKMLVPLYVYPGAAWDQLIATAATGVKIVAIINPANGPNAQGPDSPYKTYMQKFVNAGIEMVGYVHTSYGTRDSNAVLADVNTYAALYSGLSGIFFDEAATAASTIPYYSTLYNAVKAKSGWYEIILNPGAQPDSGYLAVSTNIVIYENPSSSFGNTVMDSWITCAPSAAAKPTYKYKFSAIIHTALQSDMPWLISQAYQKGVGMVYVTDYPGGCCTYNNLNTYFTAQGATVKSLNVNNYL